MNKEREQAPTSQDFAMLCLINQRLNNRNQNFFISLWANQNSACFDKTNLIGFSLHINVLFQQIKSTQ